VLADIFVPNDITSFCKIELVRKAKKIREKSHRFQSSYGSPSSHPSQMQQVLHCHNNNNNNNNKHNCHISQQQIIPSNCAFHGCSRVWQQGSSDHHAWWQCTLIYINVYVCKVYVLPSSNLIVNGRFHAVARKIPPTTRNQICVLLNTDDGKT